MAKAKLESRKFRAGRVRYKISQVRGDRMRLSIFRSARHIYAQVIDDEKGQTVVSASTLDSEIKGKLENGGNCEAAALIGRVIAEKALAANIKQVVFDRGGFLYHGRTRQLADAAREAGLEF
ncbi:MAG: 50S ribosomal protein L18 [Magnetococcales bacterium]|nr:50S ribosomal protein L18 [Magnetococcales bacterium]